MVLVGCNFKNDPEVIKISSQYLSNDLIDIKLKLYEINIDLHPILDSVIEYVIKCNNYKNAQIGFDLTTYRNFGNRLLISITNNTRLYEFDYSICNGVFYYKGYQFVHVGEISDSILTDLNQTIKLNYVSPEKLQMMYQNHDEFFYSSWTYIFESNKFKCISYRNCSSFWADKKYLITEDS